MESRTKGIVVAVVVVALLGAGEAWWFLVRDSAAGLSDTELLARLKATSGEDRDSLIEALSFRGEGLLPVIKQTFDQAGSDDELRIGLAQAVYRMPPTKATAKALQDMAKAMGNSPLAAQIGMLAADRQIMLQGDAAR